MDADGMNNNRVPADGDHVDAYWFHVYQRSSDLLMSYRFMLRQYAIWGNFVDYLDRNEHFRREWSPLEALEEIDRQNATLRMLKAPTQLFRVVRDLKQYLREEPSELEDRMIFTKLIVDMVDHMIVVNAAEFAKAHGLGYSKSLRHDCKAYEEYVWDLSDRVMHHAISFDVKVDRNNVEKYLGVRARLPQRRIHGDLHRHCSKSDDCGGGQGYFESDVETDSAEETPIAARIEDEEDTSEEASVTESQNEDTEDESSVYTRDSSSESDVEEYEVTSDESTEYGDIAVLPPPGSPIGRKSIRAPFDSAQSVDIRKRRREPQL